MSAWSVVSVTLYFVDTLMNHPPACRLRAPRQPAIASAAPRGGRPPRARPPPRRGPRGARRVATRAGPTSELVPAPAPPGATGAPHARTPRGASACDACVACGALRVAVGVRECAVRVRGSGEGWASALELRRFIRSF
jgi:hypothetical protein